LVTKSRLDIEFGRKAALLACSALVSAFAATPALAQAAEEETGIADIVVTAQKREQSMQDVPVAVTAVSAESLQANRVVSLLDLSSQAPNLAVRTTAGGIGTPTYTMRGSLTYGSVTGQDKTIGIYQDGVYVGFAQGSGSDFPELQRIEVLRGPQGTLFGRNSTAGAISIVTRDPGGEFAVRQQFTYGNYDQLRSSTTIETPSWGPFSALVNYTHSERNGEIRNLDSYTFDRSNAEAGSLEHKVSQTSAKRLGDRNNESIFAAVKFEPSDRFKMVYKFDWNENRFTPEANYLGAVNTAFFGDFNPATVDFGDVMDALLAAYPPSSATPHGRSKTVHNGWTTPGYSKVTGHNLTATWKVSDDVSIKNVLGYRKSGIVANVEIGGHTMFFNKAAADALSVMSYGVPGYLDILIGSPLPFFGGHNEAHARQWSDEIQVNYDSEALTLTAGGIYFNMRTSDGSPNGLGAGVFTAPVAFGIISSNLKVRNYFHGTSLAGYAQAEVHVTPQLDLVAGFRVTNDRKSGTTYSAAANNKCVTAGTGVLYDAGTCNVGDTINPVWRAAKGSQLTFTSRYRDTRSTYSIGANYKATDDILLFAKYSTGFVSGGSVSGVAYEPETVKAIEAGIKADLFDRRLRANLAVFSAKYKNLQFVSGGRFLPVADNDLNTLILREGDLDTKGFEFEMTAVPVQGLTLNGALGYTHSNLKNINTYVRKTDQNMVRPAWTANVSAQYDTQPLFGDAFMTFRLDGNYRSKTRQLQGTTFAAAWQPFVFSDPMWIVNGRVALRDIEVAGAKAELALWGRNLFNTVRPGQPIDFTVAATTTYTQARTYGVDLNFAF